MTMNPRQELGDVCDDCMNHRQYQRIIFSEKQIHMSRLLLNINRTLLLSVEQYDLASLSRIHFQQ
jgi:hypothetical protein